MLSRLRALNGLALASRINIIVQLRPQYKSIAQNKRELTVRKTYFMVKSSAKGAGSKQDKGSGKRSLSNDASTDKNPKKTKTSSRAAKKTNDEANPSSSQAKATTPEPHPSTQTNPSPSPVTETNKTNKSAKTATPKTKKTAAPKASNKPATNSKTKTPSRNATKMGANSGDSDNQGDETVSAKERGTKAARGGGGASRGSTAGSTKRATAPIQNYPHYLIKSEPHDFSFDDLEKCDDQTTCWEGVRNHQAKNIMKGMKAGQRAFFYHSNAKPRPGVVGIVEIVKEAYTDSYQFDKSSKYFDARATQDNPTWVMVDVKWIRKLNRYITLDELKAHAKGELADMVLLNSSRLSVQPVLKKHWDFILSLEETKSESAE